MESKLHTHPAMVLPSPPHAPPEPDPLVQELRASLVAHRPVADAHFDSLLPARPRIRSASFWSAVEVAQTASRWLTTAGATRVLDVGSGVGKFCTIAALSTARRVWGLELRAELVAVSRQLAHRLRAEVEILEEPMESLDVSRFDGFYFFNPFAEHLMEPVERYDDQFPASPDGFLRDVSTVERWLRAAPLGTAMVTYNGLGGRIPLSWKVEKSRLVGGDYLRLWVKRTASEDLSDALIELNEHLVSARQLAGLIRGKDPRVRGNPLVARLVAGFS